MYKVNKSTILDIFQMSFDHKNICMQVESLHNCGLMYIVYKNSYNSRVYKVS